MPILIDPLHFADTQSEIKGAIQLNTLSRLKDMLINDSGSVAVEMSFYKEGSFAILRGQIKTELVLQCQSCLKALSLTLDSVFKLAVVASLDQAEILSEEFEPLLLNDRKTPLADIVEDELLLCLPNIPRHEQCCFKHKQQLTFSEDKQSNPENPFSILATLKNTGDN